MMTLFEDLRLALRKICRTIGLSGTALAVVPLVVIGIGLNIAALGTMNYLRAGEHPRVIHQRTDLRSATRTEIKVVKAVLTSTLKKIGHDQRRWCVTRGGQMDRQIGVVGYDLEVGFAWEAPGNRKSCNATIMGSSDRKMATVFVEC
jgi:hypothetical protein